jgi:hypothetical protein
VYTLSSQAALVIKRAVINPITCECKQETAHINNTTSAMLKPICKLYKVLEHAAQNAIEENSCPMHDVRMEKATRKCMLPSSTPENSRMNLSSQP